MEVPRAVSEAALEVTDFAELFGGKKGNCQLKPSAQDAMSRGSQHSLTGMVVSCPLHHAVPWDLAIAQGAGMGGHGTFCLPGAPDPPASGLLGLPGGTRPGYFQQEFQCS